MPAKKRELSKSKKVTSDPVEEKRKSDIKVVADIKEKEGRVWCPSMYTAFKILLSARLCAAVWSNISDCDEVFNYWEPLHFLLYGEGFQTWEYSPKYALRSYAYLWLHAIPSFIYGTLLQSNRVLVFYFMRCVLGLCSALCDMYFYKAASEHFGPNVGRLMLLFLTVGSGMFISSTAFLPSTFCMYLSTVAIAAWFSRFYEVAIFVTALSSLVGWPFAAILGLPILVDMVIVKRKVIAFIKASVLSLLVIMVPLIITDSKHFGRLVIAPLNIVMYNVFTSHGPDLYGTEPWWFYILNGLLNFNFAFLCALFVLPSLFLLRFIEKEKSKHKSPALELCLAPLILWMLVFFPLAHKEERFLFPVYPMICLAGASTIDSLQKSYNKLFTKKRLLPSPVGPIQATDWFSLIIAILFCLLSLSRTVLLYRGYRAPIETYMELGRLSSDPSFHPLPPEYPVNLCVGKEWYRFPSSFFLPENWRLQFIQSEFRGQLPKPFAKSPNATKIIPSDMNDLNLEEKSRYINIDDCDYLIDSDYPAYTQLEPRYSADPKWNVSLSMPFLDASRSNRFLRAFYIPYFTDYYCQYVNYNLLQRANIRNRLSKKQKPKPKLREKI